MAVNRAVEEEITQSTTMRAPVRSETWSVDTPPSSLLNCEMLKKRRRSRVNLWDKRNKFCSIDELELENDFFMKAIY